MIRYRQDYTQRWASVGGFSVQYMPGKPRGRLMQNKCSIDLIKGYLYSHILSLTALVIDKSVPPVLFFTPAIFLKYFDHSEY